MMLALAISYACGQPKLKATFELWDRSQFDSNGFPSILNLWLICGWCSVCMPIVQMSVSSGKIGQSMLRHESRLCGLLYVNSARPDLRVGSPVEKIAIVFLPLGHLFTLAPPCTCTTVRQNLMRRPSQRTISRASRR